ncbi:hypothetical protein NDU88_004763 [Pleurodeles waltl]|uniref:Uncharacterized protein n=1 Tax=Pleurodeles waltl TaxID=8319 RepID=A0AAV7NQ87_PLEWA|nr:hypothetical protein NDU88_004763 [Pleurodeles waltl]
MPHRLQQGANSSGVSALGPAHQRRSSPAKHQALTEARSIRATAPLSKQAVSSSCPTPPVSSSRQPRPGASQPGQPHGNQPAQVSRAIPSTPLWLTEALRAAAPPRSRGELKRQV